MTITAAPTALLAVAPADNSTETVLPLLIAINTAEKVLVDELHVFESVLAPEGNDVMSVEKLYPFIGTANSTFQIVRVIEVMIFDPSAVELFLSITNMTIVPDWIKYMHSPTMPAGRRYRKPYP